jgi:hypothetical protein
MNTFNLNRWYHSLSFKGDLGKLFVTAVLVILVLLFATVFTAVLSLHFSYYDCLPITADSLPIYVMGQAFTLRVRERPHPASTSAYMTFNLATEMVLMAFYPAVNLTMQAFRLPLPPYTTEDSLLSLMIQLRNTLVPGVTYIVLTIVDRLGNTTEYQLSFKSSDFTTGDLMDALVLALHRHSVRHFFPVMDLP